MERNYQGRDLLCDNLGKAIRNGVTAKIWHDSWIFLLSNVRSYGPITEEASDFRVSDLLTSDLKWNTVRIVELLPSMSKKIQCMRSSQEGVEDTFIWQPLKSGIYSVKSRYHSAVTSSHTVNTPTNMNWYKDVWSGAFSPKLKVFIWSIIQRALPFGENLQRRGFTMNISCQRCASSSTVRTHKKFEDWFRLITQLT